MRVRPKEEQSPKSASPHTLRELAKGLGRWVSGLGLQGRTKLAPRTTAGQRQVSSLFVELPQAV